MELTYSKRQLKGEVRMKKRVVIVGSSFAGYSTALSLAKLFHGRHDITVIDKSPEFTFLPSLVWHPFGYRNSDDISFDTRPIYKDHDIEFIEETVYGFDLDDQVIYTSAEDIAYDYLVLATGTKANYGSIKGFAPENHVFTICSFAEAERTRLAWKNFLKDPGPIVIGAGQWSGYFFAAYEFLLNVLYHLKAHDLLDKVPIHFITAEPYLTHFGIGGIHDDVEACEHLFDRYGIKWQTNAEIHELKRGKVILESGEEIDSKFTMIIPQFVGIDAVRTTHNLANFAGLIKVNNEFQHTKYPNIYGAGGSVYIAQEDDTKVPCGVPRTRYCTDIMAKTVAYNIASDILGGSRVSVTNHRLYEYCKQDMDHLSALFFRNADDNEHDLDFIAKKSSDKWANMSIGEYIEDSFDTEDLKI